MRRSKREERRILTRYLSVWDESRNRRTYHRLRYLCDSRSSGRIGASAPYLPSGVYITQTANYLFSTFLSASFLQL